MGTEERDLPAAGWYADPEGGEGRRPESVRQRRARRGGDPGRGLRRLHLADADRRPAFIRLMLSVEESTRRTAAAVETLRAERESDTG
jgi:hypothetical protein